MSNEEYELASEAAAPKPATDLADPNPIRTLPESLVKNALAKVDATPEKLVELTKKVNDHLATWKGTGTKELFEATKRLRLDIRPFRVAVEKAAKAGREEANRVRQLWIDAEHEFTDPLDALESLLAKHEDLYTKELQRIADEKARVERERIEGLLDQLKAYEWPGNALVVAQMTPEQFAEELAKAKKTHEELVAFRKSEAERKEREAKEAAELAERNQAEQKRLAEQAAAQKADQDKLDAQRRELEDQKRVAAGQRHALIVERLKVYGVNVEQIPDTAPWTPEDIETAVSRAKEAFEKKQAEEAEVKRQADLAKAQKEADALKAQQARATELAPDREKLTAWAEAVRSVPVPALSDKDIQAAFSFTHQELNTLLSRFIDSVGGK